MTLEQDNVFISAMKLDAFGLNVSITAASVTSVFERDPLGSALQQIDCN